MNIIRFLAIAVLAYLGYKALQRMSKKNRNLSAQQKQKINDTTEDILKEDPVCGRLVPQHQAVVWKNNNTTFYFCSGECCAIFQKRQGERP